MDARVIEYTWRYVNKCRGGPDRRFGNNTQLPVIETADLIFSSDSGFQSKLKFSNVSGAEALVNGDTPIRCRGCRSSRTHISTACATSNAGSIKSQNRAAITG